MLSLANSPSSFRYLNPIFIYRIARARRVVHARVKSECDPKRQIDSPFFADPRDAIHLVSRGFLLPVPLAALRERALVSTAKESN